MAESGPSDSMYKWLTVGALAFAINHWFFGKSQDKSKRINDEQEITSLVDIIRHNTVSIPQLQKLSSQRVIKQENGENWGSLQLIEKDCEDDALLQEISMMRQAICAFEKINNLIVDLQLHNVRTYPCPLALLSGQVKQVKQEPFLVQESLVTPGEFVIQNCVFKIGQDVSMEKKYMRAGPRATQYFDHSKVRADIVCLGKVAPGVNNIVRELVILLRDLYKVDSVTGVRFSFKGYYEKKFIELTTEIVETIHHQGGSFLGVSKTEFFASKIVDSLEQRKINQLYLIGGHDTLLSAHDLYEQIVKRKLNIAICVSLKAINKDLAIVDTCFGFQSAVEESQKFIEEAYALSKSNFNSVALVKVPGRYSGFLAMEASQAARNTNICLVPEFPIDLYGDRGLLKHICDRVKQKGYCIVVYSQGASYAVRDLEKSVLRELLEQKQSSEAYAFDLFLKKSISEELTRRSILPHNVYLFDSQQAVRSVPANSFDTKLCCQIALCSVQCLMCGYTNFALGHLKNRVAMVPIRDIIKNSTKFCLKVHDENWQKLLANTGQPAFLNLEDNEEE